MNRESIIAALQSARATVAALEGALAAMDGAPERAPAGPRWIDTSAACRILGRSSSWAYANAHKYGLGHRTASGSWAFDRDKCAAFRAGMIAQREESDASANSATADDSSAATRAA